ncbi:MAG TPA: PaaI family thioesterase [Mycobacteriales bacterium]|nr:PaaI family thioesterase [Mycobacteriales bacterium]
MSVADWVERIARGEVPGSGPDGTMPPHYPTCFGCGPEATAGMHLRARADGEQVVADYTFGVAHSGAPGIAHGGTVAALVDDLMGYVLFLVRTPAVTRRLEVDYLQPVLVNTPYALRGWLERREGRKLFTACVATAPDGSEAFRAKGLFILVDLAHFAVGSAALGRPS